jgi:hypothetical protein
VDRPLVQIVASCTDRKLLLVPTDLRMRTVRARRPDDLFKAWWDALDGHDSRTVPAIDLYAGHHWAVVRDLTRTARAAGVDARLWVTSAGYGLVPEDAPLHAYAATFTPDHPDAVTERGDDAARRWWHALGRRPGPNRAAPRTLSDLVAVSPGTKLLVVASPRYLHAMADDLLEATSALRDRDDLIIVSGSPGPAHEELRGNWIPSVASLRADVRGTTHSLQGRIARRILEEAPRYGLGASAIRARFVELARNAPPPPQYERAPQDDEAVRRFVAKELRNNPAATHTRLLRILRDSGRACEQARFKQLFLQVKEH